MSGYRLIKSSSSTCISPFAAAPRFTPITATGSHGAASSQPFLRCYGRNGHTISRSLKCGLTVPDHKHVPVLDDVLFAFQAQEAFFAHTRVAAMIDQRLPVHHFGSDKLLLEIAVDGACGLLGGAMHRDGPGPDFGLAGR